MNASSIRSIESLQRDNEKCKVFQMTNASIDIVLLSKYLCRVKKVLLCNNEKCKVFQMTNASIDIVLLSKYLCRVKKYYYVIATILRQLN